jgi:hypothetical protein
MPAPKFTIEYTDGTTEDIKLLPKAQLAYEAETGRSLREDIESITQMYELAWYAAGRPEGGIEKWIENVEAIVPEDDEEDGAERPTSPDQSLD